MNAFEIKHVTKRYGDFVLEDLNLALPQGCILGLVGENGAGKSTAIRLLMGLCRPDAGEIEVMGTAVGYPRFTNIKQDVGVVLDETFFPDAAGAREIGRIMGGIYSHWSQATYARHLSRFGLPERKAIREYSRGMKMKLAFAAALSHEARLLVLDEATSGLDPMVRDEILDILLDFTCDEGHSVLISSHIVTDLEKICDYIAFLHRGKLRFFEEKDALNERYAILRCGRDTFAQVDPKAVIGVREGAYQMEALLWREAAPKGMALERAGIEDIMLLTAKGDKAK